MLSKKAQEELAAHMDEIDRKGYQKLSRQITLEENDNVSAVMVEEGAYKEDYYTIKDLHPDHPDNI